MTPRRPSCQISILRPCLPYRDLRDIESVLLLVNDFDRFQAAFTDQTKLLFGTRPSTMSTYSSSSQDDAIYSTPGPKQYQLVTPGMMNDPRSMSQVSPGFIFVNFLSLPLISAIVIYLRIHLVQYSHSTVLQNSSRFVMH